MASADADADGPALVRVWVEVEPYHLDRPFDYLLGDAPEDVAPGWRIEVNFAGRRRRALVVGRPTSTEVEASRLRPVKKVLGDYVWLDRDDRQLVEWAATRWCGPRADVVRHALPGRTVRVEEDFRERGLLPWTPASALAAGGRGDGAGADDGVERDVGRAAAAPEGWQAYDGGTELFTSTETGAASGAGPRVWRPLADEDVVARLGELVTATLRGGRDVMVVVPDAGSRIAAGLVADLHEVLDDLGLERDHLVDVVGLSSRSAVSRAWLGARTGLARVLVGERRVAFWPLAAPGLFVVLDEANPGHKERRSPRHHVREVVLERARRSGAVALLTTFVPSAATWALLRDGRVGGITPSRAAEVASAPEVVIDDHHRVRTGRSGLAAIRAALSAGDHAVVLAARGGEGRAMVCRDCGHRPTCPECGSSLAGRGRGLACPTCGWSTSRRRCQDCGSGEFVPLAAGTGRLADELARTIDEPVAVLEGYDADVPPAPSVLVMTRGSVLDRAPGPVGAVVVPDFDSLVRRPSVDAPEDTLRLLSVLGTWLHTGTGTDRDRPRMVVVTREPEDLVATTLRRWDPAGFWRTAAPERAPFPPARTAVAVTAPTGEAVAQTRSEVAAGDDLVLGPVPLDDGQRLLLLTHERVPLVGRLADVRRTLSGDNTTLVVDVEPVGLE